MSSPLQICNDLFAKVPLLTEEEVHLLLYLNKQLGDEGVQTDLSMMQEQNSTVPTLLTTTGAIETQIPLMPERTIPPNSPTQYPQTCALAQGLTDSHHEHRMDWPRILSSSESDDIAFPEISYFLEDNRRLSRFNADHSSTQNNNPVTHSDNDKSALHSRRSKGICIPKSSTNLTRPTSNGTFNKYAQAKPKKPHIPVRRWSQTYLNGLTHKHAPKNLPDGIVFTEHTDVQDLPLVSLVPPIKAVEVEVDGEIRFIGAGTRVDVPVLQGGGEDWTVDVDANMTGSRTKAESQFGRLKKETPFRVVTMNKDGTILIDMSWAQDVTVEDTSVSITRGSETEQLENDRSHVGGGQGRE